MIGGDDALKRNLQKLKAGRIDMAIDERSVVTYMIDQLGLQDDLQVANYGEATELHIGFSPALEASALYAQQLTEGVAQLKASGRYGEILKRYGLTE
jgi:polar amino acid transport system substrate-binding protein